MEGTPTPPARRSSLSILLWLIVIIVAALVILQATGVADVVSKGEAEEIIDRPHDQ